MSTAAADGFHGPSLILHPLTASGFADDLVTRAAMPYHFTHNARGNDMMSYGMS